MCLSSEPRSSDTAILRPTSPTSDLRNDGALRHAVPDADVRAGRVIACRLFCLTEMLIARKYGEAKQSYDPAHPVR